MPEWDNLVFDYVDHNKLFFWLRGNSIYDEGNRTIPPPPTTDEDGKLDYALQRDYWRRRNRHYAQNDVVRITSTQFSPGNDSTSSMGKLLAERTSSDDNWSHQAANIFVDPCVWGNARPMQIIFPLFFDLDKGKNIGELRFKLSPLPNRQTGIEGRLRTYHIPQKIFLGSYQHGFNAGYGVDGNINTTKTGNPYLGDIRTPFSYQGPSGPQEDNVGYLGSSFGRSGMSGQVQVLELYENGSKIDERECWFQKFNLRLSIYQPDSTTGAAKVFFGSLDQCSTFGIFHEASTSFLQHDELGNIGCAFPSYEVIRDYSWQNEQWRILEANYLQRTRDTTGTPTQLEPGHVDASFHNWETENGIYADYMRNGRFGKHAIFLTPIQYSFENEIKSIGTQGRLFYNVKNSGSSLGLPYGDIPNWRYGRVATASGGLGHIYTTSYLYNILNSERLHTGVIAEHAGGQYPNEDSDWTRYWTEGTHDGQQRPRHPHVAWNSDPGEYDMKDFIKRSLWASPKNYSDTHAPALGDENLIADKVSCKLTIDPFLLNASAGTPSYWHQDISWTDATTDAQMIVGAADDDLVGRFFGPNSIHESQWFDPWDIGFNFTTGATPNCQLSPGAFYGQRVSVKRYKYSAIRLGGGVWHYGLYMWDGTNWLQINYDHGADDGNQGYNSSPFRTGIAGSRITSVGRFTFNSLNNRWLSFENKTAAHYGESRTLAQGLYAHDKSYDNEKILTDKSGFTHFEQISNYSMQDSFSTGVLWGPDWGDQESLPNGSLSRQGLFQGEDIYGDDSAEAQFAFEDLDNYSTGSWKPPGPWTWHLNSQVFRRTNSQGTILNSLNEKLASGNLLTTVDWNVTNKNPDTGQTVESTFQLHAPASYSFLKKGYLVRTQAFAHVSKHSPTNEWNPEFVQNSSNSDKPPVSRHGPDQNDIDRDSETAYEKNTDGNLKHIHAYKFHREQYENGESSFNSLTDNPPLCVPFADGSTKWGFKIYLDCEEYAENINGYGGQAWTDQTKTLRRYPESFGTQLYPPSLIDQLGVMQLPSSEYTMAQLNDPPPVDTQQMTSTRIGVHVWVYLNEEKTKEFTRSKNIDVKFPIRADDYTITGRESAQMQADMEESLKRPWYYDPVKARAQLLNEGSVCIAHIQHVPTRYQRSLELLEMGFDDPNNYYSANYPLIGHHHEYRGWELPTIFDDEDDAGYRRENYGAQQPNFNRQDKNDFRVMTRANADSPGSITLRLD